MVLVVKAHGVSSLTLKQLHVLTEMTQIMIVERYESWSLSLTHMNFVDVHISVF